MSKNQKNKIVEYSFFVNDDADEFDEQLKSAISNFQQQGYYVEVQFSTNNYAYSALVIAREQ